MGSPKVERCESPACPVGRSKFRRTPAYSDTMYVDNLIGPNTVNTVPPATLKALLNHGKAADTLEIGVDEARDEINLLSERGVDFDKIMVELEDEGVSETLRSPLKHCLKKSHKSASDSSRNLTWYRPVWARIKTRLIQP